MTGYFISFICISVCLLLVQPLGFCQDNASVKEESAGEFAGWGIKVPLANYYIIKSALTVFGARWGKTPATAEELEESVWEQLLLSYEAYRRDIIVEQNEVAEEINKILNGEKVAFDWKQDNPAYEKWVKEKMGGSAELFENMLKHQIQLEKLRQQVLNTIKPVVAEEEAYQEFLNEYNTLELELAQFDALKDAEDFYKKMQNPKLWEKEAKKDVKFYKHPGFVSLEFLMDMWKIPKDDLYKMLKMDDNAIYPAAPIYKGYGVFRILKKRVALEADFPKLKDSYFKQVESIKKYEGLRMWVKQLKAEAKIKPYVLPPGKGTNN